MQPKRESEAIRRQQLEARPTPDAATDAVQVDVQVDVHVDSRLWKAEDIGGCLWAASVDGVDQRQRALRSSGSLANGAAEHGIAQHVLLWRQLHHRAAVAVRPVDARGVNGDAGRAVLP